MVPADAAVASTLSGLGFATVTDTELTPTSRSEWSYATAVMRWTAPDVVDRTFQVAENGGR